MENNMPAPWESLNQRHDKDTDSSIDFNVNFDLNALNHEVNRLATDPQPDAVLMSETLLKVLATERELRHAKAADIVKRMPILKMGDTPIIFPHTINVIQGQAGTHKSRLVETICAAFLKRPGYDRELLGFTRVNFDSSSQIIVYVDTERNLEDQFPAALQSIQDKAGYDKQADPPGFHYISLLEIPRNERFTTLDHYLKHLRQENASKPMFIVLDVATDCIADFNKVDKSMELIDLMNVAVNKHNVCFMCLIHENPGSEKARGHFGTELMNKASMVISVGFEKDAHNNDSDLIRVKFLKCRGIKRPTPIYVKYCPTEKGLVIADPDEMGNMMSNRKQTAPIESVIEHLEMYLGDGSEMPRIELLEKLQAEFDASQKTVEDRLKHIIDSGLEIMGENTAPCNLVKTKKGKVIYYHLNQLTNSPL
jgi:hypothetical protein